MKNNKKSQIIIYALLGLILLIGFSFIFYLKNGEIKESEVEKSSKSLFDITPIKLYVENCIENIGKNALLYTGRQGGYYELKKPYLTDVNFKLPYYLYENLDFSPPLNAIENEISKYMENNLLFCINNFEEFKKQGFDVSYKKPKSKMQIATNSVSFDIDFPITIKKEEKTQKIENFNILIQNIRLKNIYDVNKAIINSQIKNPNKLCLSCLYDLGEENNFYINIINYANNSLIFTIKDYNITEDTIIHPPYNFTFAIKYEGISCSKLSSIEDPDLLQECIEIRTKI